MPPLRGPIDYNRYPPRRRTAHPRETANAGANEEANTREAPEESVAQQERAPQTAGETEAAFREGETGAPRVGRSRGRARRREELLRREANRRGRDGVRVVSRRAERAAAKRKLWLRRARFVFLCLLLAGLGQGVYSAFTSPHMAIAAVELDGAHITPRESLEAVQRDLVGHNWLRAPLHQAHEDLVALPTVRAAHIARELSWPPRVLVTLEERRPFARVGGGENWFVVDEEGVPFRPATPEDDGLFAITSPLFRPRAGIAFSPHNWKAACELVHLLQGDAVAEKDEGAAATKWDLRRIYFDRHGFASIRLRGGAVDELLVQLGNDRWNEKLSRARHAIAYFAASGRRASTLNLVSYTMPIWTPSTTEKPAEETAAVASSDAL
jgi:hypothetical protein